MPCPSCRSHHAFRSTTTGHGPHASTVTLTLAQMNHQLAMQQLFMHPLHPHSLHPLPPPHSASALELLGLSASFVAFYPPSTMVNASDDSTRSASPRVVHQQQQRRSQPARPKSAQPEPPLPAVVAPSSAVSSRPLTFSRRSRPAAASSVVSARCPVRASRTDMPRALMFPVCLSSS